MPYERSIIPRTPEFACMRTPIPRVQPPASPAPDTPGVKGFDNVALQRSVNRSEGAIPFEEALAAFGKTVPVLNACGVLDSVWKAAGHDGPPDFVYYLFGPSGRDTSRFGHSAIAIKREDGALEAINILNQKPATEKLVNRLTLEDHLFGLDDAAVGAEQGGVYNRDVAMLCVWGMNRDVTRTINDYMTELDARATAGRVRFGVAGTWIGNTVRRVLSWFGLRKTEEIGNCTYWPTQAMAEADLLGRRTIFPIGGFGELHRRLLARRAENPQLDVKVAVIDSPNHAVRTVGREGEVDLRGITTLNPFKWFRMRKYRDVARLADVDVRVPRGQLRARVKRVTPRPV